MERRNFGKEKLKVPKDFTSPAVSGNIQEDLIPPSHFTANVQTVGAYRSTKVQDTSPPFWINSGTTAVLPGNSSPANPWITLSQAQQDILELRGENQRLTMSQRENRGSGTALDHSSDLRTKYVERGERRSRWESEWHNDEAERLKGQVKTLRETVDRQREDMKDRDSTLNRQSHELEEMCDELRKTKIGLCKIREELSEMSAEKEKISSQLERLKAESVEEITKLRRALERSEEDSRELVLKAEMGRLQAEKEAKQQTLKLSEQLEEMRMKQEVELEQLNTSHCAELDAVNKTNRELHNKLQSMTLEVLQVKNNLVEISTERDGLKEHLSQMGQAFETQSATLHSLRNYIGQLAPEKGEKERLNDAVERLSKEKAALLKTSELLTVRLNSVNEILALQEEEMMKKTLKDPLVKSESEGLQVLRLWREKVFKLCIQLRSKDIELKAEKDELLSEVRAMEQQLQQEQHKVSVLQHSLDNSRAELDLERVEKETLRMDLLQAHKENSLLKSLNQKAEADLKTVSETVQRFTSAFESKVAEVDAAVTRLNTFSQRLTFAKGRVETIQGLIMRKVALQKVQQASKQAEQASDCITKLQTELSLVCEERDKLTQELKRTPELIEKALADLKEQYENKVQQQQQELEQSWMEVRQAVAWREEAEQNMQETQARLKESEVNLETLRSELLSQQEHSERALQERVSEIKDHCAEKLREMEDQVNTARREHTKAVMTLRQFEKEASKKQDEMRKTQCYESQHTKRKVQDKQAKEMGKEKDLLPALAAERGLRCEYTRAHKTAAPREPPEKTPGTHANSRLLSVLEELHSLSAAVVNSSEDSAEEEEAQSDSVGPSTGSLTADT